MNTRTAILTVFETLTVVGVFRFELRQIVKLLFRLVYGIALLLPWKIGRWRWERLWDFRYANDPVLYFFPQAGVVYGRIRQRDGYEVHIEPDYSYYSTHPVELPSPVRAPRFIYERPRLLLADEGITWCRGHEGEDADAFRAIVTMT